MAGIGNDRLWGDDSAGLLPVAYHGSDYLDGEGDDDQLVGGGKDDVLICGSGNDTMPGDSITLAWFAATNAARLLSSHVRL